jgi:hypothetical protein
MRLRRRCLVGLIALALAFAGLAVVLGPSDPIGPKNYRRIRDGMAEDEVRAIIGLPPGDYYTGPLGDGTKAGPFGGLLKQWGRQPASRGWGRRATDNPEMVCEAWRGNRHMVDVYFDRDGKAVGASLWAVNIPDELYPSLAFRLRYWLADFRSRLGL